MPPVQGPLAAPSLFACCRASLRGYTRGYPWWEGLLRYAKLPAASSQESADRVCKSGGNIGDQPTTACRCDNRVNDLLGLGEVGYEHAPLTFTFRMFNHLLGPRDSLQTLTDFTRPLCNSRLPEGRVDYRGQGLWSSTLSPQYPLR